MQSHSSSFNNLYLTGTSQGSYTMRTLHGDVTGDLGKYGVMVPWARDTASRST